MKLQTLKELCCPYCAAALEVSDGIDIREDEIKQALVKCNCNIYPLIEGILVLKNNIPGSDYLAVSSLQNRRLEQALHYLLKPKTIIDRFIQQAFRRKLIFSRLVDNVRSKLIRHRVNKTTGRIFFSDFIKHLRIGGYGDYFLHRFSSTSFLASLPLVLMLKSFPGPILEIGSGMGHHGFIISSLYPQKRLVCVDASFINLFLAKRFFAPQAEFICLNANDPLPFADKKFNVIFSSDTLHYLYSKKSMIQEILRISQEEAIVLLAHLHNLKGQDPVAGNPLTAEGWLGLMHSFLYAKLLPEPQVLSDFLQKNTLNLSDNFSPAQLQEANAFMLVAGTRSQVFKNYSDIGEQYSHLDNQLILNPLYRRHIKGNSVRLRKKWPTDFIKAENFITDKIIPDTYVLDEGTTKLILENKVSQIHPSKISELMKNLILIHAPKDYYDFC
jgi:SAM-dependent methyltransferase/uncharacterized protein YbaR (Trm112 family)